MFTITHLLETLYFYPSSILSSFVYKSSNLVMKAYYGFLLITYQMRIWEFGYRLLLTYANLPVFPFFQPSVHLYFSMRQMCLSLLGWTMNLTLIVFLLNRHLPFSTAKATRIPMPPRQCSQQWVRSRFRFFSIPPFNLSDWFFFLSLHWMQHILCENPT